MYAGNKDLTGFENLSGLADKSPDKKGCCRNLKGRYFS